MSERHLFESQEEYRNVQAGLTRRKVRKGFRPFVREDIVEAIAFYHYNTERGGLEGLCHGVRRGEEVGLFEENIPELHWIGSEITPELCDSKRIFEQDFNVVREEWVGRFDVIYSNSMDHAREPVECARIWLNQLTENGCLYVEWTKASTYLGKRGNRADCWSAAKEEYAETFRMAGGFVIDRIEVPIPRYPRTIFVVEK